MQDESSPGRGASNEKTSTSGEGRVRRRGLIATTAAGVGLAAVAATMLLLVATSAQANAPRVTRGDAEAIFQAQGNGGWAVIVNGGIVEEGAPTDFMPDSMARISPMAAWNGRHFCSLDWHVINVPVIEGNAVGQSRTNTEIREVLAQIEQDIMLDGAPLETERTAIKRFLNPPLRGLVEGFWLADGRVMAPEDLSVGQHSLQLTGHRPGRPPDVFPPITFFIDGPGQGTCV